jgi:histidinol-phosphate/aromatic aminotransferase/cobyric acid decarboxylase-like protein
VEKSGLPTRFEFTSRDRDVKNPAMHLPNQGRGDARSPSPEADPDPTAARSGQNAAGGNPRRTGRTSARPRLAIRVASDADRELIYRLRHEIYARELRQHPTNTDGRLTDALDAFNTYFVATTGGEVHGFVSVTPPGQPSYSIDKYFPRPQLPFPVDDGLYEIRLLTVLPSSRGWFWALALMYAAFRWAEARGGNRIVAIGREEVLSIYRRVGLRTVGLTARAGAVTYHLLHGAMEDVHAALKPMDAMLRRIESDVEWEVGAAFRPPAPCYHGGEFFTAVGEEFDALDRRSAVINADVLDAWFPPAPEVLATLEQHLPWLLQTSPPTGCDGMIKAIARARGVPPRCILPGAGSSDLIFLALRHWLTPRARTLILDPTYGEYPHVLERVIGCHVERFPLRREARYAVDLERLGARLAEGFDLVVVVNPNSPTGQHVRRDELEPLLRRAPPATRFWVDETYVEYAGPDQSLERLAARSANVIVCKSMSKVYALSGVRAAYLCASPPQLEPLRGITPPWAVSLPAQVAAVMALQDPEYYAARYRETHALRNEFIDWLEPLGWDILPGVANFFLAHLPETGLDAATIVARCRVRGLFLRDAATMSRQLGRHVLRLAVKDAETNRRTVRILQEVLGEESRGDAGSLT